MKVYHYTSIETLALILKYKTIRFNRLDRVDDLEESEYGISEADIKMGQYNFVSCWTKDESENIALWGLYTKYKGVRISLDEDMFVSYDLFNDGSKFYFPESIKFGKDFALFHPNNRIEMFDIEYTNDLKSKMNSLGSVTGNLESGNYSISLPCRATIKDKQWEFQKESRFCIHALPIDGSIFNDIENIDTAIESLNDYHTLKPIIDSILLSLKESKPVSVEYFDIKLNRQAVQDMEILLGPETTDSERIIVESLIQTFAPNTLLKESYFKGKIRGK